MPFSINSEAVKRVPALKNKTKKQVEVFRQVFNKLIAEGESEDSAIPKAIAAANKVKKSMDVTKNTNITEAIEEETPTWFKSFLKNFTATEKEGNHPLVKQFDDEEMIAIEPLYIAVGEVDGQGDGINTMEEMESLVKSFNEANESGILQSSLFHNHKTSSFSVIKAWVNPVECFIGDNLVKEGQPIAKIQFNNKKAWELRKNGTLMGLSIGARATEVEIVSE